MNDKDIFFMKTKNEENKWNKFMGKTFEKKKKSALIRMPTVILNMKIFWMNTTNLAFEKSPRKKPLEKENKTAG